jgi:hypothetical protein
MVGKIARFVTVSILFGLLSAWFRPWLWPAGFFFGVMAYRPGVTSRAIIATVSGIRSATPPTIRWILKPHPILAGFLVGYALDFALLMRFAPAPIRVAILQVLKTHPFKPLLIFFLLLTLTAYATFSVISYVMCAGAKARKETNVEDCHDSRWLIEGRTEYVQMIVWFTYGLAGFCLMIPRAIVAIIGFFFSEWITTAFRYMLVVGPSYIGELLAFACWCIHTEKYVAIGCYGLFGYFFARWYAAPHHAITFISSIELVSVTGLLTGVVAAMIIWRLFSRPYIKIHGEI